MTKKIFRSIALVAALVFVASMALIMSVLYTYFINAQMDQMKSQAVLAAQGVDKNGASYMEGLSHDGYRLTWIDPSGKVLYDSAAEAGSMENHLKREEVQEALKTGEGESSRYSTTLTERQLYVAKKTADGSIIRIADAQYSVLGLIFGVLQQILIVAVIALALSLFLAYRLSKWVTKPLNDIDLDHPEDAHVYAELEPLLNKVRAQQKQIRMQSDQLQQKQKEFDASTANMEEGLLILNDRQELISINRAASGILDIPQYPMGRPMKDLSSLPELEAAFEKTMSGENTEMDMQIGEKQYRLHASPVVSSDHINAVVIFILDISRRLREEQMRREFTANVSHELKTPLQTISGSAELIAEGMVAPEDIRGFGQSIRHESSRLISLIDDIIGLSRLDEGAEDMRREEVDMYAVAEHAVAELTPAASASDIKITLFGESAMVRGDITLLSSIVHNLCENAVKYSLPPGIVDINVTNINDEVCLTVTDHGIGIPEEDQEHVFERFYRVDKSRSKDVGGTGLGLSIVKHAVMIHNGRIDLKSRPGEGTVVTVTLPAAASRD